MNKSLLAAALVALALTACGKKDEPTPPPAPVVTPAPAPAPAAPAAPVIGGGIAGVASKREQEGIKIYNEKKKYNEWEFVYDISKDKTRTGGGVQQQAAGATPAQQAGSLAAATPAQQTGQPATASTTPTPAMPVTPPPSQ